MNSPVSVGDVFGYWTAVEKIKGNKRQHPRWVCTCRCGAQKPIDQDNLVYGRSRSCGCGPKKTVATHGMSRDPRTGAWRNFVSRCTNPDNAHFKNYGGRGIKVCDAWLESLTAFVEHIGPRPSPGMTVERIDNNGNYEPGNVKWATRKVQARNKRSTFQVAIDDRKQCIQDWATDLGVTANHFYRRMRKGMTPQQAIEDVMTNPPKVRGPYQLSKPTKTKEIA